MTEELGFDAMNHRAHGDLASMSKALRPCHDGIDGHFENVGGYILDAVLLRVTRSRAWPLCGMIAITTASRCSRTRAHPRKPA